MKVERRLERQANAQVEMQQEMKILAESLITLKDILEKK
jgi:hypothetical protein